MQWQAFLLTPPPSNQLVVQPTSIGSLELPVCMFEIFLIENIPAVLYTDFSSNSTPGISVPSL